MRSNSKEALSVRALKDNIMKYELRRSLFILVLSIVIGIIAGFGGVIFILTIEFLEHIFYVELYKIIGSLVFLFAPTIGGFLSGITTIKTPDLRGDGVPNVIYSVHFRGGDIKGYVGPIKTIASAITIGSGGSAGREGAIAQIGASFASVLAKRARVDLKDKELLTVSGVSAGIASAFGAPLSGMLFGLEIVLLKYSVSEMVPVVLASVIGAGISVAILGPERFLSSHMYKFEPIEFPFYIIIGFVIGLTAVMFVKFFYFVEETFNSKIPFEIRPGVGGFLVGIIGILTWKFLSINPLEFGVLGAGVRGIQEILSEIKIAIWILLLIGILKMITTSLTVGSGGAGGVFYPSLLIGAALGGALGGVFQYFLSTITVEKFALLGMSAFFSAVAGCPFTMSILVIEISGDLDLLPASMVVSFISYFTAAVFLRGQTIYTLKEFKGKLMDIYFLKLRELKKVKVHEVMKRPDIFIKHNDKIWKAIEILRQTKFNELPVVDSDGNIIGIVTLDTLIKAPDYNDLVCTAVTKTYSINKDRTLFDALMLMSSLKVKTLLVRDDGNVVGIIDRDDILYGLMLALEKEMLGI